MKLHSSKSVEMLRKLIIKF